MHKNVCSLCLKGRAQGDEILKMASELTKRAREIIQDPGAPEEKWLAAAQVINDDRKVCAKKPLGLSTALIVSGLTSLGMTTMFVGLHAAICGLIGELTLYQSQASFLAIGYALWFVPPIIFASIFNQLRLRAGGERSWTTTLIGAVVLYLVTVSTWAIDSQPVKFWDGMLLVLWNFGCVGATVGAVRLSNRSFAALDSSIGAGKMLSHSIWSSILFQALLPGLILISVLGTSASVSLFGTFGICSFTSTLIVSSLWLFGSGFIVARRYNAFNPTTARTIAIAMVSPLLLANLIFLPVLLFTTLWLTLTGPSFVSWVDFVGALLVTSIIAASPAVGGHMASKFMQNSAARQLSDAGKLDSLVHMQSKLSTPMPNSQAADSV